MRSVLLPATALGLLAFCSQDSNRRSGETGMAPDAAARASIDSATSSSDSAAAAAGSEAVSPVAILSQLYLADNTEIQISRLAARQAASPAVKRLAAKLVADHAKNREEERALAQKLNVTLTPAGGAGASADSLALPSDLQGKVGSDFDKAFLEYEIKSHQGNIQRIQTRLLPAAPSPPVKAYLQKTLTVVREHLASLK